MAGIPGSRRRVLDGDLAVGALDDHGRREAFRLAGGDREAVVLDEHRLPAAVDDRVENVQLDALGTVAVGRRRSLDPHRDRRTGAGEERDSLERCLDGDALAAGVHLAGVPVVPVAGREVDVRDVWPCSVTGATSRSRPKRYSSSRSTTAGSSWWSRTSGRCTGSPVSVARTNAE